MLKVKLLNKNARLPQRNSKEAAGYDLYSPCEAIVPAKERVIIPVGISIELPECPFPNHIYAFKIISRSGLSAKKGIEKGAGLIDKDYRGEIKIILYNHSEQDYTVHAGDAIAQGIIITVATCDVVAVDQLSETERGNNGFGSTDIRLAPNDDSHHAGLRAAFVRRNSHMDDRLAPNIIDADQSETKRGDDS